MGYVDRRLTTGESVLYHARLHWVIFIAPALIALLGLVAIAIGGDELGLVGAALLFVAVALAMSRWIVRSTSEFAVTNRRVLIKVGVISRHSVELLLTKVEGIGVDQDLWGRLLDYGTVVVSGTGGTREAFAKIADPLRFRTEVQSRVPV
jgi:uncharacterized membrane protein YdbT with pleckstrin-like domain